MDEMHAEPPGARGLVKPHRGAMVLVFGLLGIVPCCISVVFGIVAWAMGSKDLREMRGGFMDPAGQGLTSAGRVLGIVGVVVNALAAAGFVWVMATGAFGFFKLSQDVVEFQRAMNEYHEAHGHFPERLDLLLEADPEKGGPFLREIPQDPWGQPYRYERKGEDDYEMTSSSMDEKPDTQDDVVWNRRGPFRPRSQGR